MKKLIFIAALAFLSAAAQTFLAGKMDSRPGESLGRPAFAGMTEVKADGEIAVIVNEDGPITGISRDDIKDIYVGDMRFSKGVALLPINYREGPVRDAFIGEVVGMGPKEYRFYWVKKVFQEGLLAPSARNSPASVISSVREKRGAIGYLPRSELDGERGVKVVLIIKHAGNDK